MSMASSAILSNFFEEQCSPNYPQCLSGLSCALFPTTFLKIAVCICNLYLPPETHILADEIIMLDTMSLVLKLHNWIWKNTKFFDGIRDLAPTLLESKVWRTGESPCLPPMWSRFKSWCWCHMWVEFVVGSLLFSERFFSRYSGFPLSSKTNIFTCTISKPYLFIYLFT